MIRIVSLVALMLVVLSQPLRAADMAPRDGWEVFPTQYTHAALFDRLSAAIKANKMGLVTKAGPTGMAKKRGVDIPNNMIVGVFNNVYAVRILGLSTAAMIEAPIRFYLTENSDGTATLSWKTPSSVFAPYMDEAGADLVKAAAELDVKFMDIAKAATAAE